MQRVKRIIKQFKKTGGIITEKRLLHIISHLFSVYDCKTLNDKQRKIMRNNINALISSNNIPKIIKQYGSDCFYQLNGTQSSPDFILLCRKKDGKYMVVSIEHKSAKQNSPQFNSHIPDAKVIVFISIKCGNFIVMGETLFPTQKAKLLNWIYDIIDKIMSRLWNKYIGKLEFFNQDYIRRMGMFNYKALINGNRSDKLLKEVYNYLHSL